MRSICIYRTNPPPVIRAAATATRAACDLISDMQEKGVKVVAPCCDITSLTVLKETLKELDRYMPPVKGCIQVTMLLRVSKILLVR